jgi:hypothetical protein
MYEQNGRLDLQGVAFADLIIDHHCESVLQRSSFPIAGPKTRPKGTLK